MENIVINDLSVVIPINEILDEEKQYLVDSLKSISKQKNIPSVTTIVYTKNSNKELIDQAIEESQLECELLFNDTEKTDFSGQINFFASQCETKWFSILEFDDEYSSIAFQTFLEYRESYEGIKMFLPLIADTNLKKEFLKFSNEIGLVKNEKPNKFLGFVDFDMVKNHIIYKISGAFISTEEFVESGMLKSNIKYHFIYEFLLRWTHKENETMVMFKLTYQHLNFRENAYETKLTKSNLTEHEFNFFLEKARKEYYFHFEREIEYVPEKALQEETNQNVEEV